MSGAILMASGRVPMTVRIVGMFRDGRSKCVGIVTTDYQLGAKSSRPLKQHAKHTVGGLADQE